MIVSQAMIRIKKKYGIQSKNWPYDELLLLIPKDGREEEMLELCKAEMVVRAVVVARHPAGMRRRAGGDRYDK